MSRLRSASLLAALIGLAALGQEPLPRTLAECPALLPEEIKRKQTKAEKKRAKRAARNLRLAQTGHPPMTADDVRARFEANLIRRHGKAARWIFEKNDRGDYTTEQIQTEWNGYRAAHADLSGEVRELVELAEVVANG